MTPILVAPRTLVVTGGCLSGTFTFESVHLHWPQSEHIHRNLNTNETAVFAYFFTFADSQSEEKDDKTNTIQGGLSSFMIGKKDRFVHYFGGLTTSPCTERIIWLLVSSAIELRDTSFNRFRTNFVASNYRETQPLNGRIVRRSFPSTSWTT
ncbi:hypothetical protein I4U23_005155 [Adineta vaga]|nr:hypothetical protein I4U23_005155 [Adineta vaga]